MAYVYLHVYTTLRLLIEDEEVLYASYLLQRYFDWQVRPVIKRCLNLFDTQSPLRCIPVLAITLLNLYSILKIAAYFRYRLNRTYYACPQNHTSTLYSSFILTKDVCETPMLPLDIHYTVMKLIPNFISISATFAKKMIGNCQ
jgi:hypothetical protein